MSGSALHGKKPSSQIQSANLSCHLAPLLRKPYRALLITSMWPSLSPNSGPAIMLGWFLRITVLRFFLENRNRKTKNFRKLWSLTVIVEMTVITVTCKLLGFCHRNTVISVISRIILRTPYLVYCYIIMYQYYQYFVHLPTGTGTSYPYTA